VGSPTEIYDRPANAFVASFIGSPAMNLLKGEAGDGSFLGENARIDGLGRVPSGPLTLGFRAEDATLSDPDSSPIAAPVYSFELLGDATMVTLRAGGALVAVKAPKDFRAEIGEPVGVSVAPRHCHLFDPASGQRVEPAFA
jgi:multiple sugar transport system ATP-binding protein